MKERIRHLILFILLVIIDQGSKLWVSANLMGKTPIVIIPDILKLQYHENTGAVWGILSGKVEFLTVFTVIVLLFILFIYTRIPEGKRYGAVRIIIVFILSGAVGNLIDRVFRKYVVDFIYFEIINFPLFNFADMCLTVSSILLLVLAIFYYKDEDFAFLDNLFKRKKKETETDQSLKKDEPTKDEPTKDEPAKDEPAKDRPAEDDFIIEEVKDTTDKVQ